MKINIRNKFINFINKNIFICIILIFVIAVFLQNNDLAKNVYFIMSKDHDTRLAENYENKFFSGHCRKQSHGYIIYIKNKFKNKFKKNFIPRIINLENRSKPYWLFYNVNSKINHKQVILLNYKTPDSKKFDISEYKVIDNFNNKCFFLEKND